MTFYELIDSKVIDYAEIVVILFENCNLECVFCPQNHNSNLGTSEKEIISKTTKIIEWIKKNNRSNYFKIHIMGGELFQDKFIESNFLNYYQNFIDVIKKEITDKNLVFNFVTNLVFKKNEPVINFLKTNNLKFSVSYDSNGRFKKNEFEIFKQNIEIFKDYIEMISLVATKQNIKNLINGDNYYDYLYENFICHWDSFLPSVEISEKLMPSERELLEFYKVLVDKYPKTLNAEYFLNGENNKMSCTRGNSFTILHDNTIPNGCSGSIFLKNGETKNLGSEQIVINFLNSYDCFSCEYYKNCSFTCFIQNDYKKIKRDLGKCVFKEVYKYVDNKTNN